MRHPAGLLHNTSTGRYHPVLFRPSPAPSDGDDPVMRYRSKAHHTEGFPSEAEALRWVQEDPALQWVGVTWEWDGVGLPTITTRFDSRGFGG